LKIKFVFDAKNNTSTGILPAAGAHYNYGSGSEGYSWKNAEGLYWTSAENGDCCARHLFHSCGDNDAFIFIVIIKVGD
jgi:hypothetical protein